MTDKTTVTRKRAAELLGCSQRTVDRRIPPGTPGRTDARRRPGKVVPAQVEIELRLIMALLPAPGGDTDAE